MFPVAEIAGRAQQGRGLCLDHRCQVLECHHAIKRRELDADDAVGSQDARDRIRIVGDAPGVLIQIKRDDRQTDLGNGDVQFDGSRAGVRKVPEAPRRMH